MFDCCWGMGNVVASKEEILELNWPNILVSGFANCDIGVIVGAGLAPALIPPKHVLGNQ